MFSLKPQAETAKELHVYEAYASSINDSDFVTVTDPLSRCPRHSLRFEFSPTELQINSHARWHITASSTIIIVAGNKRTK